MKKERENRRKIIRQSDFANLEFVYYLCVFSREIHSKQFHFLFFSFVHAQKRRSENDKSRSAADREGKD
jgi:hypothetical protein